MRRVFSFQYSLNQFHERRVFRKMKKVPKGFWNYKAVEDQSAAYSQGRTDEARELYCRVLLARSEEQVLKHSVPAQQHSANDEIKVPLPSSSTSDADWEAGRFLCSRISRQAQPGQCK